MNNTSRIVVSFLCFASLFVTLSFACNERDKRALLQIKACWPPNAHTRSWNESTDCCTWFGVTCSYRGDRVVALELTNDYEIKGTIPPSVAGLSALQRLVLLNIPGLVGPIPRQLWLLKGTLDTLVLYNTGISGRIPPWLSRLTELQTLNLERTQITGPIPPSLGALPRLSELSLSANRLTGTIPASLFGAFSSSAGFGERVKLDLSDNDLSGEIPTTFADLDFSSVNLGGNRLTGDASFLFGRSKWVTAILLPHNSLAFDLTNVEYPANLVTLNITRNRIYGSISDQITELETLAKLDVSYNRLCGKIPIGGKMQTFDSTFYAGNACLCGDPLPPCNQSMLVSAL